MDEQTEVANSGGHRRVVPPTNSSHYTLQRQKTQANSAVATLEAKPRSQGARMQSERQNGTHTPQGTTLQKAKQFSKLVTETATVTVPRTKPGKRTRC